MVEDFTSSTPTGTLRGRKVVLGVCGGIAAYKSAELVRRLRDRGAEVRVVMTRAGQAFITPLTLQALSDHPVHTELLNAETEAAMGHITLARWADVVVIAPATADLIARLAHGLADDLLTTLCLASDAPLVLAPAMNRLMWDNPATRANINALRERGAQIIGPAQGYQACGETGPGRMVEPDTIATELEAQPATGKLAGIPVLLTAGPTREAIDPVRYISNRSSGKMGYALATAARAAGATVTMVSGPVSLPAPAGVCRIDIESAEEMARAVLERIEQMRIFIAVAAVADYRPRHSADLKLKKSTQALRLDLVPTTDILATVAALPAAPFTVGFAAETNDVEHYARRKLESKSLDMIAANRVDGSAGGFESDNNALTVLWKGGSSELGLAPKHDVARALIALIAERFRARNAGQQMR